jgi:hypothetical protein
MTDDFRQWQDDLERRCQEWLISKQDRLTSSRERWAKALPPRFFKSQSEIEGSLAKS